MRGERASCVEPTEPTNDPAAAQHFIDRCVRSHFMLESTMDTILSMIPSWEYKLNPFIHTTFSWITA